MISFASRLLLVAASVLGLSTAPGSAKVYNPESGLYE